MDKKNELLAAAREVFAEKGYKAAGISDIAKKDRMAVGSFTSIMSPRKLSSWRFM